VAEVNVSFHPVTDMILHSMNYYFSCC